MSARILVVDDEEPICRLFAETLQLYGGFKTATETRGTAVLARLEQETFDAVLLDMMIPDTNGIALLQRIKQHLPNLPVIMVSGHGSIDMAVESMLAGAADFVTKPVEAIVLTARLQKALEQARMQCLSNLDSLTGLNNHRAFQERLQEEVERAKRYHRFLSLLLMDLDYFRRYNETHGHLRGDSVLMTCASLLREGSRTTDILARYGGEEFAVILPETTAPQAATIAYRLHKHIERHKFPGEELLPVKLLTVSIGVATLTPFFGTKDTLLEAAENALACAKREGRNCVRVASY